MIPTWSDAKDDCVHADVSAENDASIESRLSCDPLERADLKSISEKAMTEPVAEGHKRQNFRQFLRSLRESKINECGPWLASSKDQDNDDDDEGFIVAHNPRHKIKNRQAQVLTRNREENAGDIMESKIVESNDKEESEHMPKETTEKKLDRVFEYAKANVPELQKTEFQSLMRKLETENKSNFSDLSEVEIFSKIVELGERTEIQTPEKTKRNHAWSNIPQIQSHRMVESGECPICFRSLSENRITLEECGHCFHSDCIRLWMKQKKTCPFCAGFSLLPDEYPRLT